jgi:GT2 family glycosyltransferase
MNSASPTTRRSEPALALGVVVPATDAAPHLDRCLRSISAAAPDEVTVIDEPGLSVVEARNEGARRSHADVIVFVDSDVLVHRDAFTRIRRALADDPRLSGVIGAYDDNPSASGAISGFRNLLHHHVYSSAAGPVPMFWTGLGALRRDVFIAAGGFDDGLRWPRGSTDRRDFMADVALGVRLADAGHRIVLDPAIQGTHLKRWTLTQMVYTDFMLRGVPWVRLILARGNLPPHLNLSWRHRLSVLTSLLGTLAILRRRVAPTLLLAGTMVALNAAFYRLLARRRGPREAALGVIIHVIHHLTSVASVFAGLVIHVSHSPDPQSFAPVAEAAVRREEPSVVGPAPPAPLPV